MIRQSLADLGLNLQGVIPLPLPAELSEFALTDAEEFTQLLLFGHGGKQLWRQVSHDRSNPIDHYSIEQVTAWLNQRMVDHRILYPHVEAASYDLSLLGRYLGWHRKSPMGIGIHPVYGTWFAYRVVLLAKSDFPITPTETAHAICERCVDKPCVVECPVDAVRTDDLFGLDRCIDQRISIDSECAYQCLARLACPVGAQHQYPKDQIRYHYGRSLDTIRVLQQSDKK